MRDRLLNELLPQIKRNCLVSDARHWGDYSLCGLLLRLRELYRFEQGLPFDTGPAQSAVEEWIGRREALWREHEDDPLCPLRLQGTSYDVFDTEGVNRLLIPAGLYYGAGFGVGMKPLFFIGELVRRRHVGGYEIIEVGRERTRDISLNPAMVRERTVVGRREITEVLIGRKFEELRTAKEPGGLRQPAIGTPWPRRAKKREGVFGIPPKRCFDTRAPKRTIGPWKKKLDGLTERTTRRER